MNTENLTNQIEQLQATLSKMEVALGTVEEAIVWTDHQGNVQWCNTAFERLVGQLHTEVFGKPLIELFSLQQSGLPLPLVAYPIAIALETRSKDKNYYQFEQNNQILDLEISWSPLYLDSFNSQSVVLVIRDISDRQQTEKTLQQINEDLERRVAERT